MKKTVSEMNITATILFFITLTVTYLYPEVLKTLMLSQNEANAITMTLVSFILLLSFFQSHSVGWKIFCLLGSFLILIETILMVGTWTQMLGD